MGKRGELKQEKKKLLIASISVLSLIGEFLSQRHNYAFARTMYTRHFR